MFNDQIDPKDVRMESHTNSTPYIPWARMTHIPTGISVKWKTSPEQPSQLKAREEAWRTLRSKLNDYWKKEWDKCISSPYYYATRYLKVNGEKFKTSLTEEEFNNQFNQLK